MQPPKMKRLLHKKIPDHDSPVSKIIWIYSCLSHFQQTQFCHIEFAGSVFKRYIEVLYFLRREFVHRIGEDAFTDAAQAAGTEFIFKCFFHHEIVHRWFKLQDNAFYFEQTGELFDERIFGFGKNAAQGFCIQWIQVGYTGKRPSNSGINPKCFRSTEFTNCNKLLC